MITEDKTSRIAPSRDLMIEKQEVVTFLVQAEGSPMSNKHITLSVHILDTLQSKLVAIFLNGTEEDKNLILTIYFKLTY